MEHLILERIPSFKRANSRLHTHKNDISVLPADVKCHIMYFCDFEHKLLLLETNKDMNDISKGDFDWQRKLLDVQERYTQAQAEREAEFADEKKRFGIGVCGFVAVGLLSGVFNIGIGWFLIDVGNDYANAKCNYPIAWALRAYGTIMLFSWVISMVQLFLSTAYPLAERFYPRAWKGGILPSITGREKERWFDLEAGEPLLEDNPEQQFDGELVEALRRPEGVRKWLLLIVKIATVFAQAFGLYLFVLLTLYVWDSDEKLCDPWLFEVAWWLVMLPWIIIGICFPCCCCCICITAALN